MVVRKRISATRKKGLEAFLFNGNAEFLFHTNPDVKQNSGGKTAKLK